MTDHALDRAQLAEAGRQRYCRHGPFLDAAEVPVFGAGARTVRDHCRPGGSAIAPSLRKTKSWPTTWAFTDWLLFERPYRHDKTLLELYVDEPRASLSPASLKRLEQVRDTQYFSRFGILDKDPATGMVALKDTRTDRRFDVYDPHIVQKEHWSDGAIAVRLACVDRCLADGGTALSV